MTAFGLRLADWLRTRPDVTMVRDASTCNGDAIRCHADGRNWIIMLDSSGVDREPPDLRGGRRASWDDDDDD